MSIHSTLIAGAATPLLMDVAGESIEIRLKGVDRPTTCTALVGPEKTRERVIGSERKVVRERRVTITTAADGRFGGLAELPSNATVTIGGIDYAIADKPAALDGTISANLYRSAARHGGHSDYRR